jgi:hypothetical protein
MILADDEGKLHLKYTYIYFSGLKDDSCGRRGPGAPCAQVQKYQHWRNFLAFLVLADDEGKLPDDEMSRASCSGNTHVCICFLYIYNWRMTRASCTGIIHVFMLYLLYVCMYIYVYVCMCIYKNINTHTHTHTHTHIIVYSSARTHMFQDEVRKCARTFVSSEETCRVLPSAGPCLSFLLLLLCCIPAAAAEGFAQKSGCSELAT